MKHLFISLASLTVLTYLRGDKYPVYLIVVSGCSYDILASIATADVSGNHIVIILSK